MLLVYGDESMDGGQQRVCAVAGVIGSEEEWTRVESLWADRTDGEPFHAKDCEANRGVYNRRPHAENLELYKDLTTILAKSSLSGFAAVSDLQAQRRRHPTLPMLYLREFSLLIDAMQFFAGERHEMAKLCFDSRLETNFKATQMYAQAREYLDWKERLHPELSFDSSSSSRRLQIADLFAHEAMKLVDNELMPEKRPTRKSWLALEKTGRFVVRAFLERFFQEEMACWKNINRNGVRSAEYREWLAKENRQHNLSNTIEFVGKRSLTEVPPSEIG